MGYSMYGDKAYIAYQTIERAGDVQGKHQSNVKYITEKFQKELAHEEERFQTECGAVKAAQEILDQA
jgi:hypothetical protein